MREANLALCFQIQNFLVTKLIEMMKGQMLMNGLNRVCWDDLANLLLFAVRFCLF